MNFVLKIKNIISKYFKRQKLITTTQNDCN